MYIISKETSPPGYISEAGLITCMEQNGIGTDASIPSHLKNIEDRGYVTIGPKRTFIPTELGLVLARGICDIDSELIMPSIRANIEKSCDDISKGKAKELEVVDHVIHMFKSKFVHFSSKFELLIK